MTAKRRILAGVDEAGLGPLLGPLVIGYSAFWADDRKHDLWEPLADVVCAEAARAGDRLVVADSKKVFTRNPRGERRLETTVLSFLAQLDPGGKPPVDARSMMFGSLVPEDSLLARHPWYARLPERLPRVLEAGSVELSAEALRRGLERSSVSLQDGGVRVVPAGELNASYTETRNKAATLWDKTSLVLRHLWTRFGAEDLWIVVDRQGGRTNYAGPLLRTFPDADVRQARPGSERPEYELVERDGPRRMHCLFAERAETESLPVALASCFAKYARELCMHSFNAYFGELQPGLRPTAGYTTDGRRWVRDAAETLRRTRVPEDVLVRRR